jgi:predicted nucleotidyltransferase
MDFDVYKWIGELALKLKNTFAGRVLFVGLQGSYRRGEAKPCSDIDVVVILDAVSLDDLKKYRNIIDSMPEKEKACGFISGKREINNWPKMDIFQFKNDTRAVFGTLDDLVPAVEKKDIEEYIQITCANLYHMTVHCYLYDRNIDILKQISKSLFFLFQAVNFLRTSVYVPSKRELRALLSDEEKELFQMDAGCLSEAETEKAYDALITYFSKGLKKASKG